jgi:zinc protease
MAQQVTQVQLDNGLTVVLKEMHHAPVISWWMFYRVGSRNEVAGITGASHWCEHMMFKGTPRFPAGELDRAISRDGGVWNAFTWIDFTGYHETMPADRIDVGLQLEADRMVNSLFDPEEVASERAVIISERQGAENRPLFLLAEEVQAACFRVHSYHHEIIGDMADLEHMTRDDLHTHYRRYYHPNNAVAVGVGDFDTKAMLARVRGLYERIPPGELPPPVTRIEPEQRGQRRVTVEREGTTAFVALACQAPPASDDDYFRLQVLDSALSGASGLGFFGGGVSNKTSRLYKALVETGLAVSVSGELVPTIDPYLYSISVTVRQGSTPAAVEEALVAEVDRLLGEPVSQEELAKAKKQAKALFAYTSESITHQAIWLGLSHMVAEGTAWFEGHLDRLLGVTAEEMRDTAQRYLKPSRRPIGWFVPLGDAVA